MNFIGPARLEKKSPGQHKSSEIGSQHKANDVEKTNRKHELTRAKHKLLIYHLGAKPELCAFYFASQAIIATNAREGLGRRSLAGDRRRKCAFSKG